MTRFIVLFSAAVIVFTVFAGIAAIFMGIPSPKSEIHKVIPNDKFTKS